MNSTTNLYISQSPYKKVYKLRLTSFIGGIIQILIIGTIFYYFSLFDWKREIEENLKIAFPDESKNSHKEVEAITKYCLIYSLYASFCFGIFFVIWRVIYNLKYLRLFDGNVNWINNYCYNIFYSMTTPIFCVIIKDKDYEFYDYFVYAEIYSAFIMAFAVIFSLLVIVWFFVINNMSQTRETGRHWEGNTQVISYEFTEGPDLGCGCYYVKKIFGCSYRLLTLYGILMLGLLIAGMNNYFIKVLVIIELLTNIYLFWLIRKLKISLKNQNENLI